MSDALTLADLSGNAQLIPGQVATPEIKPGSTAYIAALSADERDLMELQWSGLKKAGRSGNVGFRAFVVAWCLADAANKRLLDPGTDEEEVRKDFLEGCRLLGQQHAAALCRMFNLACAKNSILEKDVEELEKNSATPASDAGNGDKPSPPAAGGKPGSKRSPRGNTAS